MKIYESVTELIGGTPLLDAQAFARACDIDARLLVKLEYFNPAGSVKDRAALFMIEDAERAGRLSAGAVIVEPTSGNTGIGIAAVAAAKGYRVIIVMPDSMSVERRRMIAAYGAEIVLTDGARGMAGAIEKAAELTRALPRAITLGQFDNPANPEAHYRTTAPELWRDADGDIDVFVAGVGTGGTISGVGKYLKEQKPSIRIIAVEPSASPVLGAGKSGAHGIQGIGAGFVPSALDVAIYDEVVGVNDADALSAAREFAAREGVCVGISSGAALAAAISVARRPENARKTIAVIAPDGGDRYLSTDLVK